MPINFALPKTVELKPRIKVIGVGGAGGNAVNNMIDGGLEGVDFIVANTDAQALALNKAERKIQMGSGITQGLGAGMKPEVGEHSAEESLEEILQHIEDAHMLFVAAGMGGGTGTGAAPVIAKAARERGILTVAIVTKPFSFEGTKRMRLAEEGIDQLYSCVDTLIVIPNQNLFRIATDQTTFTQAFSMADEVLNSGVRSVTDLMVVPGLINLDFNDVRTVMDEMGKAMMGTGEATGERRAIEAAESAINNPLLDDVSLAGAKGVLINITGGNDLTLFEVDEAAELIRSLVDEDANIIVGSAMDPDLQGIVRVSVVATGVDSEIQVAAPPVAAPPVAAKVQPLRGLAPAPALGVQQLRQQVEEAFDATAEEDYEEYEDEEIEAIDTPIAPRPYPPQVQPTAQAPSSQPTARPAPPPAPGEPVPQPALRRPFGLFGRKQKPIPIAAPRPQAAPEPKPQPASSGDLFDSAEELEIPSFLRRTGTR